MTYGAIDAHLDKATGDRDGARNVWITVTLTEGKNREVRRVLEAIGLKVNRLLRLSYGPFSLGTLSPGEVEEVGPRVIRELLVDFLPAANMPSWTQNSVVASPTDSKTAIVLRGLADSTPVNAIGSSLPSWAIPVWYGVAALSSGVRARPAISTRKVRR